MVNLSLSVPVIPVTIEQQPSIVNTVTGLMSPQASGAANV
jgi:hypothetical protein